MLYIILSTYASILFFLCLIVVIFSKEYSSKMKPISFILWLLIPLTIGFLQCLVPLLTHLGVIK